MAEHLKIQHQFNKDKKTAGDKFYYQFLSRHPNLSLRKPQSTSIQRAVGFNKFQVENFFKQYEALLTKFNFVPSKFSTATKLVFRQYMKIPLWCCPKKAKNRSVK